MATIAHRLELDLDVFAGPFDLLLSLILREELDLLEVELAEIVIAYIDHLEAEGELDLEAATEFLVLIAALLELKSRLMLPGGEVLDELDELAPAEAAEELLERMLQYARFRGAGGWTAHTHAAGQAYLHRSAPLPAALRRVSLEIAERAYDPAVLGQAIGGLLRTPPPLDLTPHGDAARLGRRSPVAPARAAGPRPVLVRRCRAGGRSRDGRGDAVRAAGAVQERGGRMGAGSAVRADHGARVMNALARQVEALLFLSPDPVALDELADALQAGEDAVQEALAELADALEGRGVVLREVAGGWTLASHPDAEEAARRLLARPRTPALTPAQAETLAIVGYLQPVSRPEVARIRGVASESATAALVERGLIEESGRSQFGAVLYRTTPLFLKLFGLRSLDDLPEIAQWDPSPEDEAALRDRLLRAGEQRATTQPS